MDACGTPSDKRARVCCKPRTLYGRIYETISKDFDTIVEKMIYQLNDEECACPVLISSIAAQTLQNYESPANLPDSEISMYSLVLIVDHIKALEALKLTLEKKESCL